MKRLQIRLPDSIHDRVHKLAKKDAVSMNQFMVTAVSNEIIRQETHVFFQRRAAGFDEGAFLQALAEVPDVPPENHDRLRPRGRRP